jgi:hypothetical protein
MARKGATTRDPKKTTTPAKETKVSNPTTPTKETKSSNSKPNNPKAGNPKPSTSTPTETKFKYEENKAAFEGLNAQQKERYQRILQNKGRKAANEYLGKASGGQVRMPGQKGPAAPAAPTPESVTEEGFLGAGAVYQDMLKRFQGEQYQPNFEPEMERARQNVMQQFERRNAEEFGRQQVDVQRQIAERGLDPNSEAAQGLYKQLNQRQDLARQEAMSAAEQAAYGIQQQQFTQADTLAMRPYEQFGALLPPYMTGVGAQYQNQQLQQQQGWEAKQAELERQNRLQIARMSQGGGGGAAGPTPYDRMLAGQIAGGYNQQPQPNPWATAAQGFAAGVGQGIGRYIAS